MSEGPYWLNGISETHWEICRGELVERFIEKTADDDNRDEAEREVRELNEAWKVATP